MNNNQIASIAFIAICAAISTAVPCIGSFACLAVAICLYGFILWLDRHRIDNQAALQNQITALKDRVEAMQIARLAR